LEIPTIDVTGNPRDRLTLKEYEILQEIKKLKVAEDFSDKVLMIFAFSRKLDVKRTAELLENNNKWMKENGYNWKDPVQLSQLNDKLLRTMYSFFTPGARDKAGHGIGYIMPARVYLKDFTLKEHFNMFVFFVQKIYEEETLDAHRVGFIYIEDIKGVGLKNFDMKSGKQLNLAIQNNFPQRIKGIYIVNPGFVVKGLMAIARLFLKKKILDRVRLINKPEDLLNLVDKDQLITYFGGTLEFSFEDMINSITKK